MNFQVERLRRLPRRADETWQGGVFELFTWVQEQGDAKPVRPWVAAWISLKTRLINLSDLHIEKAQGFDIVLQALVDFACDEKLAGCRPAKIEVKDPALAEYLRELLGGLDIEIELRDKLVVLERMLKDMARDLSDRPMIPSALDAKGVTVESMRAFAEAATQFYRAEPWEHLSSDDLIEIESPFVEAGLRCTTVLSAGGDTIGLGFHESRKEFQSLHKNPDPQWLETGEHWSVLFGPITDLPFDDVDLWDDENLPVADEDAYPLALCYSGRGKNRRPGRDVLAFLEGLLRALAETSEEEIDRGRWKRQVDTCKGPLEFALSLPDLLEPQEQTAGQKHGQVRPSFNPLAMERVLMNIERAMEGREFESEEQMQAFLQEKFVGKHLEDLEPTTPLERAEDLVYRAYEALGRRQIHLARQALETSPDCADAYVLLAECTSNLDKQLEYYTQAVQAAERTLDPEVFETEAGRFWGISSTRPYMRARFGRAECLEALGRLEQAAEHYRELLRLNPNDNQGVRSSLWPCLLRLGQDDEVDTLLKQYKGDKGRCAWDYTRALLTFRQKGDTATARKHLRQAIENNELAAGYLLGEEPAPAGPSVGSEEEATSCVDLLIDAWFETPGALEWLEEVVQRL
jgi:tetratricopeptide (TPR) repeat protein